MGQNPIVGIYSTPLKANPNLKWESTSQINIGIDYGFFKRVTGAFDVFVKNTNNMLVQVNLPTTTGYSSQWQNAATMRTTGLEFSFNSENVRSKNFQWSTSFNISLLNNKITGYKTTDSSTVSALNTIGVIKGQRTNSYYTYIYNGIDTTGSLKFKDIDGNGSINSGDRQIFGSPDPKIIVGLGNNLTYKRINLGFFFVGNFGNKLFNQTMAQYIVPTANGIANAIKGTQNYWTKTNTGADIPSNAINNGGSWIYNSRWIEKAWFIRMQNVNLSYTLPARAFGNVFNNVRIYAQAQNLLIITPYKGMDPEAANNNYLSATENMPAFLPGSTDISAYPPVRTFTIGINLGF
ncbi:MAG: TonB-dependent receptor [Segetibacter sp.]